MIGKVTLMGCALTALILAAPALAADWGTPDWGGNQLRGSNFEEWEWTDETDPVGFEIGTRYWYSMGSAKAGFGGREFSTTDTTHILEGHFRIDDYSTNTYVKGLAGYSVALRGSYDNNTIGGGDISAGAVGYAGADIGHYLFGDAYEDTGIGVLAGYQFWNDSPQSGRGGFAAVDSADDLGWVPGSEFYTVPFDSVETNIDIHALRLGLTAKGQLTDKIDFTAELAAIPYAHVSGVMGGDQLDLDDEPGITYYKSSQTDLEGWTYGAAAEAMVGYHPTENIALRFGGRAWYLQGAVDASYRAVGITDPVDQNGEAEDGFEVGPSVAVEDYISKSEFFSVFRYGALAELTFKF